jgi:hypothetical protein
MDSLQVCKENNCHSSFNNLQTITQNSHLLGKSLYTCWKLMKYSMQFIYLINFIFKNSQMCIWPWIWVRLDAYKTGEYVPLSQGGMSALILLFTIDISPTKCDVFMFVTLRIPLKLFWSKFLHQWIWINIISNSMYQNM